MTAKILFVLSFLAFFMPGFHASAQMDAGDRPAFETDVIAIETRSGRRLDFDVELAVTPHQRAFGLMFVERMPADQGMLFIFDDVAMRNFWMRNTLISLDIIFIDSDGVIINIADRAIPGDERPGQYGSERPAKAVLEINGGLAAMIGVRPGDRVLHPAFGSGR